MTADCNMPDAETTVDVARISAETANEKFTDELRRLVGHGKRWSVARLAEASGIEARTMAGYHSGETGPCFFRLLRLAAVLGPEFVNGILAQAGLGGVRRLAPNELSPFCLNEHVAGLVAVMGTALRDGHVDHLERIQINAAIRQLQPMFDDFLNAGGTE